MGHLWFTRISLHSHKQQTSAMVSNIVHYYRKTEPPHSLIPSIKEELKDLGFSSAAILDVETESCFNVQVDSVLTAEQTQRLEWLLAETFEKDALRLEKSAFDDDSGQAGGSYGCNWTVEFGPRMTFTSAFSSNAVSICKACDLPISRLEVSRRYRLTCEGGEAMGDEIIKVLKSMLHDRMTEEEYPMQLTSFDSGVHPEPVKTIPILEKGRAALEEINKEMGLGFDDFDLDYYTNLFKVCVLLLRFRMRLEGLFVYH
jgi:phosphoribosylformylglycinamidine synthase